MNFDNLYKYIVNVFLTEGAVDIPRTHLDPTVFEFPEAGEPVVRTAIKVELIQAISQIQDIVPVNRYYIIGSILTKNYNSRSDIDVTVEIDPTDLTTVDMEALFGLVKRLNGGLASGTTHPVNFYIVEGEYNLDKAVAAYDPENEKWIKLPPETDITVQKYFDQFQNTVSDIDATTAELRRDIIDLTELQSLQPHEVENLKSIVEQKLKEIETGIQSLVQTYTNVKRLRKTAFEKDLTPEQIKEFGHRNRLPQNIIYKLLERYYYVDFIKELKKILGDDETLDVDDVEKIKKASKTFYNN